LKALHVRSLGTTEMPAWDLLVKQSPNGLLFAEPDYLCHFQHKVLGVFERQHLVAGMAVPYVEKDDGVHLVRSSYVSPYFIPIFGQPHEQPLAEKRRRRAILSALIDFVTHSFQSMVLPLHPSVADMVPFQEAHFSLELRYTYRLNLGDLATPDAHADAKVRNHLQKAINAGIVVTDEEDAYFDFDQALFYEPEDQRAPWNRLVRHLLQQGKARIFIARLNGQPVGGLFLAFDTQNAYNLLSYFDRDCKVRGIPSLLLYQAIAFAKQRNLQGFDFEGSVLPSIERFFEAFGGCQCPYFQVHWFRDAHRFEPIQYFYD